jgi:hypothetical protein
VKAKTIGGEREGDFKDNLITFGVKAEDLNCAPLCCGDAFSHVHHHQKSGLQKKVITSPLHICEMMYQNFL